MTTFMSYCKLIPIRIKLKSIYLFKVELTNRDTEDNTSFFFLLNAHQFAQNPQ